MPAVLMRIGVALLAACLVAAGARAPVELSVLSYNTHGLPAWIAGDDPAQRFPLIAKRLPSYQVALIQEDWEWHELLVGEGAHPVVERGNGPETTLRRAFGLNGSGLTTLVSVAPESLVEVTKEALGACAGWVGGGMDCWASKGFVRLRVRLSNGAELDLYNLHLDAGQDEADREARAAQLERLSVRMEELSANRALVLGGDFNLSDRHPEDARLLADFRQRLRLTDSGARGPSENARIDYVFYRSGGGAGLELIEAREAEEFVHEGEPLSDHPALAVRFRVRSS